jgi:hypothetical protein
VEDGVLIGLQFKDLGGLLAKRTNNSSKNEVGV